MNRSWELVEESSEREFELRDLIRVKKEDFIFWRNCSFWSELSESSLSIPENRRTIGTFCLFDSKKEISSWDFKVANLSVMYSWNMSPDLYSWKSQLFSHANVLAVSVISCFEYPKKRKVSCFDINGKTFC